MARHETTLRTLRALHLLETSRLGLSARELTDRLKADGYAVSKRQVLRDLQCLEEIGFDLNKIDRDGKPVYSLSEYAKVSKNVRFTYKEVFALYIVRNNLDHLKGSPVFSEIDSLFTKLEKLFGTNIEAFTELVGNIKFRPRITWHTSVQPIVLDTVYNGIEEGHPLKMVYRAEGGESAGKETTRTVGPECLYFANGGVYLIAKDLNKNEPRTYALARIKSVEMDTSKEYSREGLSPENLFKDAFGVLNTGTADNVEIALEGPMATFIAERRWHNSQTVVNTHDGIFLRMHVKINEEFVHWVLSLGPSATVVAPDSLKQAVLTTAQSILSNYNKKAA
ncbi:MAG: WYL domain-containing protein [Pseudobdellovibrionaceae bacterium]|nr:WYL domain-containing protein [Bdellovibrionales bacterium]USN47869.1 MAG: WYL domain-containing protein [Pseudobdellovibrionaceae bacterium]